MLMLMQRKAEQSTISTFFRSKTILHLLFLALPPSDRPLAVSALEGAFCRSRFFSLNLRSKRLLQSITMSLLSASLRIPGIPASLRNETSSSSSVEGLSSKVITPRTTLFRRHTREPSKRLAVLPTCHYLDRVSRVMLTRGWSSGFKRALVGACLLIVLIMVLIRNSMCPISMLIHRIQASARQAERQHDSVRSVPVQVAHELINAGHRCVDVRTREEYIAGHVEGAVNIPYLVKCGPGMSKNHRFLEEVEAEFGKDDEIIVGCQSGRRSMMAAAELRAANFTGITDMGGGYVAWKESGLPVAFSARQPRIYSV